MKPLYRYGGLTMKTSLTVHAQHFFTDHLKRAKWTPCIFYAFALLVISGPFVPMAKADEFIVLEYNNMDSPGNDLGKPFTDTTQDQCLSVCKANRECRGFYWVDGKCYFKRKIDDDRTVTKPKENGVLVKVMEFRRIPNQDAEGNDIKNFPSGDESGCQSLCASSRFERCAAYYWVHNHCWLKHSVGTLESKDHEPGVFGIRLR